jgi:hypothetical protein
MVPPVPGGNVMAAVFSTLLLAASASDTLGVGEAFHEGRGTDSVETPRVQTGDEYVRHGFYCVSCDKYHKNERALSNHYRWNQDHRPVASDVFGKPFRRRNGEKYKRKFEVANELLLARAGGEVGAIKRLKNSYGYPVGTMLGWCKQIADVSAVNVSRYSGKKRIRWYRGQHDLVEQKLYIEFCNRRCLGRVVTGTWLQKRFRKLVIESGAGKDERGSKGSNGWLRLFNRRWNITSQCRSNKKCQPIEERLGKIQAFHSDLIYGIQWTGKQRCAKYGRFPGTHMFHMDQIPVQFSSNSKKTYNSKSCRDGCRLGDPSGSDAGKRFATVQLTIRADGPQIVPIEVIFRKTSDDLSTLSIIEINHYLSLPNIRIRFQPKAWADEIVIRDYVCDFRKDTLELGEVMLGMDHHGSQQTGMVRTLMDYLDIFGVYTPANCTDVVSPCDHHVGKHLQSLLAQRFEQKYDECQVLWDEDGLRQSQKRMLLATWASEAWAEMSEPSGQKLMTAAFVETGFLLAKDGSENSKVKMGQKGEYDF